MPSPYAMQRLKRRIKRVVRKISGRDELIATAARFELEARLAKAFARAAATAATRNITPHDPRSREFAGFSQHGEDGILDVLCAHLDSKVRFFVEMAPPTDSKTVAPGWHSRTRSAVSWSRAIPHSAACHTVLEVGRVWNVWPVEEMVDCSNVDGIMKLCPYRNPDVFVIDIDGIDFHVLQSVRTRAPSENHRRGIQQHIWP